jgi:hypothetical protein
MVVLNMRGRWRKANVPSRARFTPFGLPGPDPGETTDSGLSTRPVWRVLLCSLNGVRNKIWRDSWHPTNPLSASHSLFHLHATYQSCPRSRRSQPSKGDGGEGWRHTFAGGGKLVGGRNETESETVKLAQLQNRANILSNKYISGTCTN